MSFMHLELSLPADSRPPVTDLIQALQNKHNSMLEKVAESYQNDDSKDAMAHLIQALHKEHHFEPGNAVAIEHEHAFTGLIHGLQNEYNSIPWTVTRSRQPNGNKDAVADLIQALKDEHHFWSD